MTREKWKRAKGPNSKPMLLISFTKDPPTVPISMCLQHTHVIVFLFYFLSSSTGRMNCQLSISKNEKWTLSTACAWARGLEECGSMYQLLTCNSFIYLPNIYIYIYITHPARQFDASAADSANGRWTVKLQRLPGILLFLSYHIDLFSSHLPCIRSRLIIVPAVPPQSPPTALPFFPCSSVPHPDKMAQGIMIRYVAITS